MNLIKARKKMKLAFVILLQDAVLADRYKMNQKRLRWWLGDFSFAVDVKHTTYGDWNEVGRHETLEEAVEAYEALG